jgi:hypothetical protein
MSAIRTIYHLAGLWNEHWGRIKTLAIWIGLSGAGLLVLGGFLVQRYGWLGAVAIIVGGLFLLGAIAAFVVQWATIPRLANTVPPPSSPRSLPQLVEEDGMRVVEGKLRGEPSPRGHLEGAGVAPAPFLTVTAKYLMDGPLIFAVRNDGPTISGGRINLLAPKHRDRVYLYRMDSNGAPIPGGTTNETAQELLKGYPVSLRWTEGNFTIYGYSTTECRFFMPRRVLDPVQLRIGSDALEGWRNWTFIIPADDEMVLTPADLESARVSNDAPDPVQVRRALDGAIVQLTKQRALIWEWRLHAQLDPDERGEWETEDRKRILHQDPRFRMAYLTTEDALNAISRMKDPTSYRRDQALEKIDLALVELEAASELLND